MHKKKQTASSFFIFCPSMFHELVHVKYSKCVHDRIDMHETEHRSQNHVFAKNSLHFCFVRIYCTQQTHLRWIALVDSLKQLSRLARFFCGASVTEGFVSALLRREKPRYSLKEECQQTQRHGSFRDMLWTLI